VDTKWDWVDVEGGACADLPERQVVLTPPSATLAIEAFGGAVAIDRINLKALP
jgi:hypothetical protein